ncbi:hypothetical protein T07_10854, partial [Trichinella nelsoni]
MCVPQNVEFPRILTAIVHTPADAQNIYSRRQCPRSAARRFKTPFKIWSLFMIKDIIVITLNTDIYISKVQDDNELNLCDLHNSDGTGIGSFSSTMSIQRLRFLLGCMRFEDHATRSERKLQDKLTPI